MLSQRTVCVAILGVLAALTLAAAANDPARFEMQFDDLPMRDIIHRLGAEKGIAISFEELALTDKDGVTLGEEAEKRGRRKEDEEEKRTRFITVHS